MTAGAAGGGRTRPTTVPCSSSRITRDRRWRWRAEPCFNFVTEGIHAALERARDAAGAKDIRLLGGASVIRQYLQARAVDEMHLAVSPILLGSGEHLLAGLDLPALGYRCGRSVASENATHYVIERR